jgi:hypothetical protein
MAKRAGKRAESEGNGFGIAVAHWSAAPMKNRVPFASTLLVLLLSAPLTSRASDHIDGLKTAVDNAADLSDVFAFTSPADPSKLVLVMNVHSIAFGNARFSNAVDYKLRIRPIEDPKTLTPSNDPRKEQTIVCNFSGGLPLVDANQRATCSFNLGGATETIRFDTRSDGFRAGGDAQQNGIRVFAGVRSDPWFLDLAKVLKINAGHPLPPTPGINGLFEQNVLSIVVEVDKRKLPGPLVAVNAQTVRK